MKLVLSTLENSCCTLSLNRPEKRNALDEHLIQALQQALNEAYAHDGVKMICLKGEGSSFCAGADLAWMQRQGQRSLEANEEDAFQLAQLLHSLYHAPKPTVVQVHGQNYGGALGLIAACDFAFASDCARFCFSEVKLGLMPAVISPYIVEAIGVKRAKYLFMTAEVFQAQQAYQDQLIHRLCPLRQLDALTQEFIAQLVRYPHEALHACKTLPQRVAHQPIDEILARETARWIAVRRTSQEACDLIQTFLDKK
jgi:methylglutaconyl-CoA hydratase